MEILSKLWVAMTTENETYKYIINIISFYRNSYNNANLSYNI